MIGALLFFVFVSDLTNAPDDLIVAFEGFTDRRNVMSMFFIPITRPCKVQRQRFFSNLYPTASYPLSANQQYSFPIPRSAGSLWLNLKHYKPHLGTFKMHECAYQAFQRMRRITVRASDELTAARHLIGYSSTNRIPPSAVIPNKRISSISSNLKFEVYP